MFVNQPSMDDVPPPPPMMAPPPPLVKQDIFSGVNEKIQVAQFV